MLYHRDDVGRAVGADASHFPKQRRDVGEAAFRQHPAHLRLGMLTAGDTADELDDGLVAHHQRGVGLLGREMTDLCIGGYIELGKTRRGNKAHLAIRGRQSSVVAQQPDHRLRQ